MNVSLFHSSMDLFPGVYDIYEDSEEDEPHPPRGLNDRTDPFHRLNDIEFIMRHRVSKHDFIHLLELIQVDLHRPTHRHQSLSSSL